MKKSITYLCLDPGSVNFGVSVMKFYPAKAPVVIFSTMLKYPINNLTAYDLTTDVTNKFRKEIKGIIQKYKPDWVVAERYTSRMRGSTVEMVNIMLGIILALALPLHYKMSVFQAMTWKNQVKKKIHLDDLYTQVNTPDHMVDATMLGCYGATLTNAYDLANLYSHLSSILDSLESKATHTINRKRKRTASAGKLVNRK